MEQNVGELKKWLFILMLIGILGISCLTAVIAQVNHRYPRTAIFQWGGAPAEWYARYDLVDYSTFGADFAKAIKKINPDTWILPTRDWNAGAGIEPLPDVWICRNSKGARINLYGSSSIFTVNMTDYCPLYNGKRYNEYLPEYLMSIYNLSVLDGIATDGLWIKPIDANGDIDLDGNRLNDYTEAGKGENWVNTQWKNGVDKIFKKLRSLMPSEKLLLINSGIFHDFNWAESNGVLLEQFLYLYSFDYFKKIYDRFMAEARLPHVLLCDFVSTYDSKYSPAEAKNFFMLMRFDLTLTLLGDGYFGFTDQGGHHYSKYYDEMDLDLGYPTSNAKSLSNGIWVRFFDNGVSIVNPSGATQRVTDSDLRSLSGYAGPYYRFKGGQDPSYNDGSQFDTILLTGDTELGGATPIGDGIVLLKEPKIVITDIILDDADAGTSPASSPANFFGNWIHDDESGGDCYQLCFAPWRGLYKCAYAQSSSGENMAIYTPTIGVAGIYEVFEWHGWLGNSPDHIQEATNTPYTITYGGGKTASGTINQSTNSGKWNSLGIYYFDKGSNGNIKISNNANGSVIADAFKLVFKGIELDNLPPNDPRDLRGDNRTENSITLTWLQPLPASDGDVATSFEVYRNNTLVANPTSTSFMDSGLSENTTYSYAVYAIDNMGNRSNSAATGNFVTLADVTPPTISSVKALGITAVEIIFNEPVEKISAENITNYSINNITVRSAVLLESLTTVRLTTSEHVIGVDYTLVVNNIRDRVSSSNIIAPNSSASYKGVGDSMTILISADNDYELYVNGMLVGTGTDWETAESYSTPSLAGENVVAVKCIDTSEPAGLLAEINFNGRQFVSNETWKVSTTEQSGWKTTTFDDRAWQKATSYGLHGVALPWAQFQNVQGVSTSSNVQWIWSADNVNDDVVYFRFTLSTKGDTIPPDPPTGVIVRKP